MPDTLHTLPIMSRKRMKNDNSHEERHFLVSQFFWGLGWKSQICYLPWSFPLSLEILKPGSTLRDSQVNGWTLLEHQLEPFLPFYLCSGWNWNAGTPQIWSKWFKERQKAQGTFSITKSKNGNVGAQSWVIRARSSLPVFGSTYALSSHGKKWHQEICHFWVCSWHTD